MDVKLKPYKKDFPYSYAIGVYPTIELLENKPHEVLKVLIHSKGSRNKGVDKIIEIARKNNIKTEIADGFINKISESENNYAIGIFNKYTTELRKDSNHLVLVEPRDMGNMGTIIRTMSAYEIHDLAVIRPAVDLYHPKTIRASMGSLFQINFSYFDTFSIYLKENPERHLYPFMTNGKMGIDRVSFASPYSLIFGNESSGLTENFREIGTSINIPQSSKVDSLNLSVAVGIALYRTYWSKMV